MTHYSTSELYGFTNARDVADSLGAEDRVVPAGKTGGTLEGTGQTIHDVGQTVREEAGNLSTASLLEQTTRVAGGVRENTEALGFGGDLSARAGGEASNKVFAELIRGRLNDEATADGNPTDRAVEQAKKAALVAMAAEQIENGQDVLLPPKVIFAIQQVWNSSDGRSTERLAVLADRLRYPLQVDKLEFRLADKETGEETVVTALDREGVVWFTQLQEGAPANNVLQAIERACNIDQTAVHRFGEVVQNILLKYGTLQAGLRSQEGIVQIAAALENVYDSSHAKQTMTGSFALAA